MSLRSYPQVLERRGEEGANRTQPFGRRSPPGNPGASPSRSTPWNRLRALMNCVWEHDRELVPIFAIAIFAGLRPDERQRNRRPHLGGREPQRRLDSSPPPITDNKTETKRFVPIEPNLRALACRSEQEKGSRSAEKPPNSSSLDHRGEYQGPPRTPEKKWKQLVTFRRKRRALTSPPATHLRELPGGRVSRSRYKVKEYMGALGFQELTNSTTATPVRRRKPKPSGLSSPRG